MGKHSAPKKTKKNRRRALAITAGLATFSMIGAFAATLGSIASNKIGAAQSVVASCDTVGGIAVDYITAYDPLLNGGLGAYAVTHVALTLVDAGCDTQTVEITLADGAGASLANHSSTLALTAGASGNLALSANVQADMAFNISIVIHE